MLYMNDNELLFSAIQTTAETITTRIMNDHQNSIGKAVASLSEAELLIVLIDLAWTMMSPDIIETVELGEMRNRLVSIWRYLGLYTTIVPESHVTIIRVPERIRPAYSPLF